jgi:hypothetical protein
MLLTGTRNVALCDPIVDVVNVEVVVVRPTG